MVLPMRTCRIEWNFQVLHCDSCILAWTLPVSNTFELYEVGIYLTAMFC